MKGRSDEKRMAMKKKMQVTERMIFLILILGILLTGCGKNEKVKKEVVEHTEYEFADITWTRTTEADTEYITFFSDGSFSYYCACGNPVDDSDLCEGYTYDDQTKKIKFDYSETTASTITTVAVKNCDANSLELDFDGEIRKFTKQEQ